MRGARGQKREGEKTRARGEAVEGEGGNGADWMMYEAECTKKS